MTDATVPYQAQQVPVKKKSPLIIVIVIVAIAIAGIFVLRKPKKTEQTIITPTEEKVQVSPTEETAEIEKNTVKIQVLNGTGTPGQAGEAVSLLEDAGYDSSNIKTDNAEEFDTRTTEIAAKEGYSKVASDIKKVLSSKFGKINISSSLADDSEYDIVITTGGKKYEEETPTPEETTEESPTETPTPTSEE